MFKSTIFSILFGLFGHLPSVYATRDLDSKYLGEASSIRPQIQQASHILMQALHEASENYRSSLQALDEHLNAERPYQPTCTSKNCPDLYYLSDPNQFARSLIQGIQAIDPTYLSTEESPTRVLSFYQLNKCIASQQKSWKKLCQNPPTQSWIDWLRGIPAVDVRHPQCSGTPDWSIEISPQCNQIWLHHTNLRKFPYSRFKDISEIYLYPNWNKQIVAHLKPYLAQDPTERAEFKKELDFLQSILMLDIHSRQGLPCTLVASDGLLVQKAYTGDGFHMMSSSLDIETQLEFFAQVSKGLKNFHALHAVHSDFKPENTLFEIHSGLITGILTDFDASYQHQHLPRSRSVGSPKWAPPEHWLPYPDRYPIDEITYRQKGDVFSQALVILTTLEHPLNSAVFKTIKKYQRCQTGSSSRRSHRCQEERIKDITAQLQSLSGANPNPPLPGIFYPLISRSLSLEPEQRPSAKEFSKEYNQILKKLIQTSLKEAKLPILNSSSEWAESALTWALLLSEDRVTGGNRLTLIKKNSAPRLRQLKSSPYHIHTLRAELLQEGIEFPTPERLPILAEES